jgi:hypothetical protein
MIDGKLIFHFTFVIFHCSLKPGAGAGPLPNLQIGQTRNNTTLRYSMSAMPIIG